MYITPHKPTANFQPKYESPFCTPLTLYVSSLSQTFVLTKRQFSIVGTRVRAPIVYPPNPPNYVFYPLSLADVHTE